MRCEIPHRCVRRKYRIRRHSPFRLRNCWEGRSVRASSLLRQNSSSVPLSLGRTRPCKTTASPVCWKAPWRVFVAPNVHLGVDTTTAQQLLVQVPNEGILLSGSDGCEVSASAPIDSLLGGSFSSTPRDSRSHNNLVVVPVTRPLYRLGSCWLHENKYAQKGDHPYNMKGNIPHTSDLLSLQTVD